MDDFPASPSVLYFSVDIGLILGQETVHYKLHFRIDFLFEHIISNEGIYISLLRKIFIDFFFSGWIFMYSTFAKKILKIKYYEGRGIRRH